MKRILKYIVIFLLVVAFLLSFLVATAKIPKEIISENVKKSERCFKTDFEIEEIDRNKEYTQEDLNSLEEQLNKLEANLGKYIIMGNHDNTQDDYHTVISNIDFTNLDDSYQILYNGDNNPILIAGISTGEYGNLFAAEKVENALKKIEEIDSKYNILIMHEPDYIDEFDYSKFQLILAGHSHNGQVRFPFIGAIVLPPHARKYYDSHYTLDNTELYISSGVGTSTIKFRFFNRPSFNLYRIVNK